LIVRVGDRERFAAEIDDLAERGSPVRRVGLWAASHWLTCEDDMAYVPQLCASIRGTIGWIRSGCDLSQPFPGLSPEDTHRRLLEWIDGSREQFWFPRWGPTTDNIRGHLFRSGEQLIIPFEFWRETHPVPDETGRVFVARLPQSEFVEVLEKLVLHLEAGE
jgi:hypothetical protein